MIRQLSTAAAASALALLSIAVPAATPANGTVTDSTPTVEWTGGPFVVPNQTNVVEIDDLAGNPVDQNSLCEEDTGLTCDIYRFEVNVSSIDPENDLVVIRVSWDNAVTADDGLPDAANTSIPDYDLELYNDTTGEEIVLQQTGDNPEVITLPAANGKYRLQVIPFNAGNTPYAGKVTFEKFEEDKSGALSFAGAFGSGALGLLGLAALARRRIRR
jgi:hypothetical protein